MSAQTITISEDVISSVIKPVSLFLNDLVVGSTFTHIMLPDATEYTKDENYIPEFKFSNSEGGVFKFKHYDLKKFTHQNKRFADYFLQRPDKTCFLRTEFKVVKVTPMLDDDGQKIYPYFAYKGYPEYLVERQAIYDENEANKKAGLKTIVYIPKSAGATLLATGIQDKFKERYYRIVDIDQEIFFYKD